MFDNIGRNEDAEGGRRRIAALLLTLGASASVTGLTLALLAWRTVPLVLDVIDTEMDPFVEVTLPGDDDELTLPAAPPMIAAARAAVAEPTELTEPVEPTALPETVPTDVRDGGGTPEADPAGDPNGLPGGDGVPGGMGDGGGSGDGVRVMHWRDLEIKYQPKPIYPTAAEGLNLGEVECRAEISIDERGIPYDVAVTACPPMFQESAERALFRWRWYPATVEDRPTKAKFLMVLRYLPNEG